MIAQFLRASWTFAERLLNRLVGFLGDLLGKLFQGLIDFIKMLFRPLFVLIAIIMYVLYKVGVLAVGLFLLFVGLGKLLFAFVQGVVTTLAGFTFTPAPRSDGEWTPIFQNVVDGLGSYQLDTLAYVLLFMIWLGTAFAVIRTIGSIRSGEG